MTTTSETCLICKATIELYCRGVCRSCYNWYRTQRNAGRLTEQFMVSSGNLLPKQTSGRTNPSMKSILDDFVKWKSEDKDD